MERESKTFCLDRDRRFHRRQTRPMPPNSGTDPARLHRTKKPKTFVQLIRGHYTSLASFVGADPATLRKVAFRKSAFCVVLAPRVRVPQSSMATNSPP